MLTGGRNGEILLNGHRVFVRGDEEFWKKILVMVDIMNIINATELYTKKND